MVVGRAGVFFLVFGVDASTVVPGRDPAVVYKCSRWRTNRSSKKLVGLQRVGREGARRLPDGMSEETKKANAAFAAGRTKRIILGDTLLDSSRRMKSKP